MIQDQKYRWMGPPVICCKNRLKERNIAVLSRKMLIRAHVRRRLLVAPEKSKDPNPIVTEAESGRKGTIQAYLYRNSIGRSNHYYKFLYSPLLVPNPLDSKENQINRRGRGYRTKRNDRIWIPSISIPFTFLLTFFLQIPDLHRSILIKYFSDEQQRTLVPSFQSGYSDIERELCTSTPTFFYE